MNLRIPILVVGATGGGVAEGILKCLRLAKYTNIHLLEHNVRAAHLYRVKSGHIINSNPDQGNYIDDVLALCARKRIKVIIPGSTWEAFYFAKNSERIREKGICGLLNKHRVINVFNDKWTTYEYLKVNGFPALKTWLNRTNCQGLRFPVIVKPAVGRGSRDVFEIFNKSQYNAATNYLRSKKISFVVQEHVGNMNQEYTVGVISDAGGSVVDSIVMQRHLGGGHTDYAKVCPRSKINTFCEKVARTVGSVGPMNIQLRLDENATPWIFEINPRFSGSAPMRALAGFNEPDTVLRAFVFQEKLLRLPVKDSLEFFRVFQEMYIDTKTKIMAGRFTNYI
jgi:carbamoyl-phosphate synthase large subunit